MEMLWKVWILGRFLRDLNTPFGVNSTGYRVPRQNKHGCRTAEETKHGAETRPTGAKDSCRWVPTSNMSFYTSKREENTEVQVLSRPRQRRPARKNLFSSLELGGLSLSLLVLMFHAGRGRWDLRNPVKFSAIPAISSSPETGAGSRMRKMLGSVKLFWLEYIKKRCSGLHLGLSIAPSN